MANFDMSQIDLGSGADIDGFLESTNESGGVHTTGSILQRISGPARDDFELSSVQTQGAPGLDALFTQHPQLVQASTHRRRIASLADLKHFTRISADTLIHRSEQDLWAISKEADGQLYIERLFNDNGEPLKG